MTTDPIADLLTRIRNALASRKTSLRVPYSKIKFEICEVLKKNGFLEEVRTTGEGVAKEIEIELKEDKTDINLVRISKPGQRIYIGVREIHKVLEGLGISILSTPKGIITGAEARKMKVGGELLCEVY